MMPQQNQAGAEGNPAVVAIREAMNALDAVKAEKEATMAQAVQNLENLNAVEDLMEAHRGKISKEEAMNKHVNLFGAHFAAND